MAEEDATNDTGTTPESPAAKDARIGAIIEQFLKDLNSIMNFEEALKDPAVGQALYTALLGKATQIGVAYGLPVQVIVHDACAITIDTLQAASAHFINEAEAKAAAKEPPTPTDVN